MKKILLTTVCFISILLISCGSGGEDDGGGGGGPIDPPPTPQRPSKAVISKPANNIANVDLPPPYGPVNVKAC